MSALENPPAITFAVEAIDPVTAKQYLSALRKNRTLREKAVQRYTDDILARRWAVAQPIFFDWEGKLIDGAHRMEAVIRSGETVQTTVIRGVDPAARDVMDDGVKRQFSDDLTMRSQVGAKEAAALMRKITYWKQAAAHHKGQGGLAGLSRFSISRAVLNNTWKTHEEEVNTALHYGWRWKGNWPGNTGALLFMSWLLLKEGNRQEVIDTFFSIITNGSQDPLDVPLVRCARTISAHNLSEYRRSRREHGPEFEVYYLIRAWNGWHRHDKLTRFALPPGGLTDPYPKLMRTR